MDMTQVEALISENLFAVWFLIGAALVFWMQAGFAMVEAGFTRAKNSGNIIMKNLMDFCIGTVMFILIGFSLLLGEDLAYQVDQIKVVLPSEDEALAIVPGEDYMTLITCTPYGVNSHRLLVRGTRVDYDFSDGDGSNSLPITRRLSTVEMVRYGIGIVSVVIVIVMLVLTIRGTIQDKRRRENKLQNAKMKAKAKLRRKGESSH